jgi:HD-GYP domain-containing protein (c-di-GMP phosphodiesterase class II)
VPADSPGGDQVPHQLQRLARERAALRHELSRAYEHLNITHELSQQRSLSADLTALETDLLERVAGNLRAVALLVDRGDSCAVVRVDPRGPHELVVAPGRIRARLAAEIDAVRRTGRARDLNLPQALERGLGPVHVMLGALPADAQAPHVVIALRSGHQPPFSADDRLASETVLVCGGQTLRNLSMVRRLQQASLETVGALANAIETRDHYTGGHSERVGWLASLTGRALGLLPGDLQMLEWSGLLHDVGKIGIPERILNKPGRLTPDEFEQIKRHPRLGFDVLAPVSSLRPVLEAVLYHHENFDGSGYPDGLRGENIPLLARILHAVDIFDALTSTRSYRERLDVDQALDLLAGNAGRITDPLVTSAFVHAFREYRQAQPEDCRQRLARC